MSSSPKLPLHSKSSLRVKIVLFFALLVLLFAVINGTIIQNVLSTILTRELLNDSALLTASFSKHLTESFLSRDTSHLTEELFDEKYSHPRIAYVFVLDQEGHCLASTSLGASLEKEMALANPLSPDESYHVLPVNTSKGPVYDIAVPMAFGRGTLRIGFFRSHIDQIVRWTLLVLLLTTAIAFVFAMLFAYFFARTIVKPLIFLKQFVQRVGQGDLDEAVEINTGDEIGDLAKAFNQMVADLKASREDLNRTTVSRDSLVREMDERRKAEEILQQEQRFSKLVLDNLPGIFYLYTYPENRLVLWNKQHELLLGYRPEEMKDRHATDWFAPEVKEAVSDTIKGVIEKGENSIEAPMLTKEGHQVPLFLTGVKFEAQGRLFFMGIGTDITERKKAEENLARLSRKNELVLNSAAEGIMGLDLEGNHMFVNPSAAKMLGYEIDELIGHPSHSLWHHTRSDGTPYPREECAVYGAFREGVAHRVSDEVFWRKDGTSFPVEYTSTPIYEQGQMVGAVVVFSDSTERKFYVEVENSRIAAELANKAKSQFLAAMSHEIRTPLNAVIGFTDILSQTPLNDEQKKYLATMGSSGKLLLSLINDILDFSKIEAGKITLEEVDFDLEYLIKDVFRIISTRVQEVKITTYVDFDKNVPSRVKGDPTRMRQILINLLNNAVKFTDQGEIGLIVELSQETTSPEEASILMTVKDTGIGIPKDKQDLLFQPFSQADMSTTRKYGGTGLGLSICKPLIEKMGGKIWLVSEENTGSEFNFTVKLKRGIAPAEDKLALIAKEKLVGKSVLVVDDNKTSREILGRYCQDMELSVIGIVSSAEEAIRHVQGLSGAGSRPDMILINVRMADRRNDLLAETLRALPQTSNSKFIAIASDVWPGAARESKQKGFHGFITKPVFRDDLIRILGDVLEEKWSWKKDALGHTPQELACKGLRVLVVEDMQTNRELLEIFLVRWDCLVDFAANGEEALEKLRANKYALCFMDLQMPKMGGLEAVQVIRREISKDLPVIALTAAAMDEDRLKCLDAGMTDYISKPINVDELKKKVIAYGRPKS